MKARTVLSLSLSMVVPAMLFAACVGADPTVAGSDAATPSPSTTGTVATSDGATTPDTSTPRSDAATATDGATGNDATADASDPDATSTDAGVDVMVDSAKPPPTCRNPGTAGAFFTRCRANPATVVPGGNLQTGTYLLQGAQGQNYCTATYTFGGAEVFTENGETYMRYFVYRAATAGDTGAPFTGTLWLTYNPATGALRSEEMCDAARKGDTRTGTIQVIGNDVTFTYANGQDIWKKS